MEKFSKIISDIFLWIMNIGLLIIGVLLSFGLIMEAKEIYHEGVKFLADQGNYQHFVEGILVFFLYFEFVALIVKYFKNNYHFPRYFIYIGITAIIRLIIVQHDDPKSVLIWAGAILLLVISLAIAEKFIKKD